jgi:O-antigen ligase
MQAVSHKPLSLWPVLVLVALAVVPMLLIDAAWHPLALGVLGAGLLCLLMAYTSDLLALSLGWLAVTTLLNAYFYLIEIPGFFNLSIDRIALVALLAVFVVGLLIGHYRWQWSWSYGLLLGLLLGWLALTTQRVGWTLPPAQVEELGHSPPYYFYLVGYAFPAILFVLGVTSIRSDRQIRTTLIFFAIFGVYLTVVGLAEWLTKSGLTGVSTLVWPRFILDPDLGIHQQRVRGPFLNAPDMGLTLTVCFFATLLLISRVNPLSRLLLIAAAAPMPLLIFLTYTRSIWLAFAIALVLAVWLWPRSRRVSVVLTSVVLACAAVFVLVNIENLASSHRRKGGVADMPPILSRYHQARITFEIAREHPIAGVGLGRFREAAVTTDLMRELGSPAYVYARGAVEHNNFLSLLAETGLPGVVLYVLLVFGLLGTSTRLYRLIPVTALGHLNRRFIVFFWIVWVVYFINAMFRSTVSSPLPNGLFLLMGGVIVGLHQRLQPQPLREPLALRFTPPPVRGEA